MKRFHFIIAILIFLSGCDVNTSQQSPSAWGEYLEGRYVDRQFIQSKITGIEYPYHIYLPASYSNNKDQHYPIIYALDGQWNFKGFAEILDKNSRDVILVGIEEGPKGSDRRSIDYRLPGAISYLDFFRKELMPHIESTYRVDSNNRSFQGTSYGGIITTAFAFLDNPQKPLFKNFVAYDPSLWDRPEQMLDIINKRLEDSPDVPANVFFTTARPAGNHKAVVKFINFLKERKISDLNLHLESYLVSHEGIAGASFEDSLNLLFDES